jgi:hypothetical protein
VPALVNREFATGYSLKWIRRVMDLLDRNPPRAARFGTAARPAHLIQWLTDNGSI